MTGNQYAALRRNISDFVFDKAFFTARGMRNAESRDRFDCEANYAVELQQFAESAERLGISLNSHAQSAMDDLVDAFVDATLKFYGRE